MHGSSSGSIASSVAQRERLAKDWLARIIDRTPLAEVGALPLSWLINEGPGLIGAIVETLAEPGTDAELGAFDRARAAGLTRLRGGPDAPEQIARDLAALQAVLVERLSGELGPSALAAAAARLAALFGSINGAVARELIRSRVTPASVDPVTLLPGPAHLDGWIGSLLAEQRRYGHPFALALIDVDGLGRINDAYGHEAGDRMLVAVAAILRRQLREVDQAFRLEEDEFAVLAPHTVADRLVRMATRVANLIAGSQSSDGPRIAIAAGVVDCPADGLSAERLLESAAEATYAAKAAGAAVARSPQAADQVLQDP